MRDTYLADHDTRSVTREKRRQGAHRSHGYCRAQFKALMSVLVSNLMSFGVFCSPFQRR